jgi:apolipoprotein N-acyltransferase
MSRESTLLMKPKPPPADSVRGSRSMLVGLPIASGLALYASFWTPIATFVALVPMGLLIRLSGSRWWIYFGAWLGGLAFFLPGIHWLRYCDEDSGWLGWITMSLYLSLYFPAFVFLARICSRRWNLPVIFTVPIVWIALEYVRMHALTGFGWLLLAHSVYEWIWLIQLADFSGVWGVGFVIALVNAVWVELLTLPLVELAGTGLRLSRAVRWRLALAAGLVVASLAYGTARVYSAQFRDGPRVLLLQSALPQSLKNNDPDRTFDHIAVLTRDAQAYVADLVIWPETSYPYFYGDVSPEVDDAELYRLRTSRRASSAAADAENDAQEGANLRAYLRNAHDELAAMSNRLGMPLLVGLIRHDFRPGSVKVYNSSVLFAPGLGAVDVYDKIHLVPFGEYLPLKDSLPLLKMLVPYDADEGFGLDASDGFDTIHFGDLHFASLICFEDTLPHLAREFFRRETAAEPIDFLVNQSNDGWFQGSIESDHHLAASVFRCVEARAPMVRASNIGITAYVDGNGRVAKRFQVNGKSKGVAGGMDAMIQLDDRRGPYIVLGDWLAQACLVIAGGCVAMSTLRHAGRIFRRINAAEATSQPGARPAK